MSDRIPPGWGNDNNAFVPSSGDSRVLAYGGFWIRTAAALLDSFILSVTSLLSGIFTLPTVHIEHWQGDTPSYQVAYRSTDFIGQGFSWPMPQFEVHDYGQYLLLFQLLYFIVLEASPLRGTLGKRVLGLRVSDMEGQRISLLRSLIRTLVKTFISFPMLMIGVLMVAFTPRKQGLHDMVAGTLVLRSERVARLDGQS